MILFAAFAVSGCGEDESVADQGAAAELYGLRVELPCLGPGSASVNCDMADADEDASAIEGKDGETYSVTIRVRGVVEQKTYSDYTGSDGMWIEGGTPDGGSWNIFRLQVSSPPRTYYLNSGSSGIDECWLLDVQKTIVMDNGATLSLLADSGGDLLGTINEDQDGEPIIVSGVPLYPYAFDGQFVQIDIVSIKVE